MAPGRGSTQTDSPLRKAKKVRSIRGVEIHRTKAGDPIVYIRYQADGTQHRERIGPSDFDDYGKDKTLTKARATLNLRRGEIREARLRREKWLSPADREEQAKKAAAEALDTRAGLLFENVRDHFLTLFVDRYADPAGRRGQYKRLARFFAGRYLDEITRADVRQYEEHRLSNTGPFSDWTHKAGPRAAALEVNALSVLYGYLDERGMDLRNPCHHPRGRHYARTKATAYRPQRKKVIPTREEVQAFFDAAPSPVHRAAWVVAYYTGARPESEWCRLTHGDVEIPDREKVRTIGGEEAHGSVTFRDTKTGTDRTIPLHPKAEAALREIMLEQPEDAATFAAWQATPIFRRRNGKAWNRFTYRKSWSTTLAKVTAKHPALAGMVVRDLRNTFSTHLREAGTDTTIAAKIQGHSARMNDHYVQATGAAGSRAILSL